MITIEQLYQEFIVLGNTKQYIADKYGLTIAQVANRLQRNGIRRKTRTNHGLSTHPLNSTWCGMKERCNNPNAENYQWYGGRGITVCQEWSNDFMSFYNWAINNGWKKDYELERIDNSKGYRPDNCTWVPHKTQCRNRRSNKPIEINGVFKLMCEWEEELGLNRKILAKWKYKHGEEWMKAKLQELANES